MSCLLKIIMAFQVGSYFQLETGLCCLKGMVSPIKGQRQI